jgi:exonuclease III
MKRERIDILTLQETKITTNHRETRKSTSWFFSGEHRTNPTQTRFSAGVAVVISHRILFAVRDIVPISDRIITVTIETLPILNIVGVYAPPADHEEAVHDTFYQTLEHTIERTIHQGALCIQGDFNARVQQAQEGETHLVGPHCFDPANISLSQQAQTTMDSRERFIAFCMAHSLIVCNTWFEKPNKALLTYREIGASKADPCTRGNFETLDYVLVPARWRNAILNCGAVFNANVDSDHYPLVTTYRSKLRARPKHALQPKLRLEPADALQRSAYQAALPSVLPSDPVSLQHSLLEAGVACLPKAAPRKGRILPSPTFLGLLSQRRVSEEAGDAEAFKLLTKQMQKQKRADVREYKLNTMAAHLDTRDVWMGLRNMRKSFAPVPFSLLDCRGKVVSLGKRAEAAAEFFAVKVWGSPEIAPSFPPWVEGRSLGELAPPVFDLSAPYTEELVKTITKCKRYKAPGPDGIPMELFKELSTPQVAQVADCLAKWWVEEAIPADFLAAKVILIFKKGSTQSLDNYRPISLLPTLYKLFSAVVQQRLAAAIDHLLHPQQYGFRARRGTTQAIHHIRRIIQTGERAGERTHLVLLDWRKAFDTVTHESITYALQRLHVPSKLINIVCALYCNPTFTIDMDGHSSQPWPQKRGIRQGCPLSPYLFLTVMTILFAELEDKIGAQLRPHRPLGASYTEILYADDTILASSSIKAIILQLREIEAQSARFGLSLNRGKCEALALPNGQHITFADGTRLPNTTEAKYLGCIVNCKGDTKMELRHRMQTTMMALKSLQLFWRHSTCPISFKIHAFNAIIVAKLLYGLESAQLTQAQIHSLDTFQLKGLRKILHLNTTFVNRNNSNEMVYSKANQALILAGKHTRVRPLSDLYAHRKQLLIAKLIRQEDTALTEVTLDAVTLRMVEYNYKRVGRPRLAWYDTTLVEYWRGCTKPEPNLRWAQLDLDNQVHVNFIKEAAAAGFPSALPNPPPLLREHQAELDGVLGPLGVEDLPR